MGAKRRLRVINVIELRGWRDHAGPRVGQVPSNRENIFTEPYADSAGAGSGAGAGAGAAACACLPMNSAIHSSDAPSEP